MWCVLVKQLLKSTLGTAIGTMLKSKTFVKKTRAGGVLKIVREHYLREDIWCGSEVCKECNDEAPVLQEDACIESNLLLISSLFNPRHQCGFTPGMCF